MLNRVVVGVPWLFAVAGLVSIGCLALVDVGSPTPVLAIGSIFAIQMVAITLHEGAHLAVAAMLGLFPITVQLGVGDEVLKVRGKRVTLVLKAWPMAGMVLPSSPTYGLLSPRQSAVLLLAGPAVDVLCFCFVLWLLISPPETWQGTFAASQMEAVLGLSAASLLYAHLREFWPRTADFEGERIPNDMAQVLSVVKAKFRNPASRDFLSSAQQLCPGAHDRQRRGGSGRFERRAGAMR